MFAPSISLTAVFTYTYNANGELSSHTDSINGETHVYTYDAKGNIAQRIVKNTQGNAVKRVEQYTYDRQGRVASVDYSYVNTTDVPTLVHYGYEYDVTGNVTNAEYVGASAQTAYSYDTFGRLSTDTLQTTGGSQLFKRRYGYASGLGNTSGRIASVALNPVANQESAELLTLYSYDAVGNISGITLKDSTNTVVQKQTYEYDSKGQMTRENLYFANSLSQSKTWVYTYDDAGNILSKKQYAYTEAATVTTTPTATYSYGYGNAWGDQLTSYNGKTLTYDAIGNPLTYGAYTYQWTQGRRLFSITDGATGAISHFTYNDEGIRTSKVAGGLYHEYVVTGGQINREIIHSSSNADSPVLKEIRYYYDASGKPIAIRAFTRTSSSADFTDTTYYLLTNLQGDVVGIYNASGTKIYEYAYDAWGNIIKSSQVATGGTAANEVNPFRYRGYYYDTETGLYYLQSRYYNPEWGRFLNADVYVNANGDLVGFNMFAYCSNNPVMNIDGSGTVIQPNLFVQEAFSKVVNYLANDDPDVVEEAKFLAFYKGKPVIKIDKFCDWFYEGKPQAASFGVIFIDSRRDDFDLDLNHEYGHSKQFDLLGPLYYLIGIAIPSVYDYFTIENDPVRYYNEPQEITADLLGGVKRDYHKTTAVKEGWAYLGEQILNKFGIGKIPKGFKNRFLK